MSRISRVFVTQMHDRLDRSTGQIVSKYDLSDARRFGDLIYLLSPTAKPFQPEPIVADLWRGLRDYDASSDWLLLIGSPVLMGLTAAVAACASGGPVSFLQWDGRRGCYVGVRADADPGSDET